MILALALIMAIAAAMIQTLRLWQARSRTARMYHNYLEIVHALSAVVASKKDVPPGRLAQPKETTQDA